MPNHKRDKDPRFNIKYNHPIQYPLKKLNINVSTVGILKSSEIPLKDFMSKEEIPRTTMDNKIPELTAESDDKNSSQPIAYIVFDKDEREAVLKIEYPYNTISLLKIKAANGEELFGTGFFISPRCIITAGHCVYHKKSWVKSIEVIPCAQGDKQPYGNTIAKYFVSVEGWFKDQNKNFDYGAIILESDSIFNKIGATLGYKTSDKENYVEIAGYPIDKLNWPFKCKGEIESKSKYKFFYKIDTSKGNSGSPIFISNGSGILAVGVHNEGENPNTGIRLREEMVEVFKIWSQI